MVVKYAIGTIAGIVLATIDAAYMIYIRVPSVLEIRPELADVGLLVAGLFGGRPMVYLFHNFTAPVIIFNAILFVVVLNFFIAAET